MAQFHRGTFKPKNPSKSARKRLPLYRSRRELTFMRMCDNHPAVLSWASAPVRIPYSHPFTGQYTHYVPDFIMVYKNKGGTKIQVNNTSGGIDFIDNAKARFGTGDK